MRFSPKILLAAMALPLCVISVAHAAPITSMTIQDVGSGGLNNYSSTLDGISGAFRFSTINDNTYLGASLFYGDIAANPGPAMGEIDTSQANPNQTFTSGFIFAGSMFIPETLGAIVADISVVNGLPQMTIDSLPFAGTFFSTPEGILFPLAPQSSAPADCAGNSLPWQPLTVQWVNQIDANHFNYKVGWSHCITEAESAAFSGLLAYWRLEGIATTAVPVPAALWLLGSGALGLVPFVRRRRRAAAA